MKLLLLVCLSTMIFAQGVNDKNSSIEIINDCEWNKAPNSWDGNQGGIVYDCTTKLYWQDNYPVENPLDFSYDAAVSEYSKDMTFEQAINYCETLSLGDFNNWRVPNLNELYSILDLNLYSNTGSRASIKQSFKMVDTFSTWYWSSTTDAKNIDNSWIVTFDVGHTFRESKNRTYPVRCVRDAF